MAIEWIRLDESSTVTQWLFPVAAVLSGFVAASCGNGDDETKRAAVATDLADTWVRAWNEHDPELVGSVFSDADAAYDDSVVYEEPIGSSTYTRDEAMGLIPGRGLSVTNLRRVGDLTANGDGTVGFVIEWEFADGERRSAEVAMELEGDLASRIKLLSTEIIES
ncbi:MAG: hypothetical protein OEV40_23030 [Acidimicrobiia bacterium]|nr:hypothetical protein [Acidimicrobiia bacterium]